MPESMIAIEGLHKRFRRPSPLPFRRHVAPSVDVLRGVDLTVAAGDYVALLGANGAGKTTILKSIATLLLPGSRDCFGHGASVAGTHRLFDGQLVTYSPTSGASIGA